MALRMVILDLETSSLEADAGIVVGAGLLSESGKSAYFQARKTSEEKPLLAKLVQRLESFDAIVTWSGRGFDIPFLTSRLMKHGMDPRPVLRKTHLDLNDVVKSRLRLTFTYLDHVCDFFGIKRDKGPMGLEVPHLFVRALEGDEDALKTIRAHCLDDLRVTREVFLRLRPLLEAQLA
ncbi:ribonuclease H-like domain-containing protein [Candidatus Bathyarchaeota archaeon]|nr:ribonuclease H-like domain-containing protein [Candidatus Bathyarchaeota archaeon]